MYSKPSFRLQNCNCAGWPGPSREAITCFHVTNILRLWRRDFVVFHETLSQKTTTVQELRLQECLLCSEKLKHVRHVVLVMSWSGLKGLDARLCRAKLQDNTLYKCLLMCQYVKQYMGIFRNVFSQFWSFGTFWWGPASYSIHFWCMWHVSHQDKMKSGSSYISKPINVACAVHFSAGRRWGWTVWGKWGKGKKSSCSEKSSSE